MAYTLKAENDEVSSKERAYTRTLLFFAYFTSDIMEVITMKMKEVYVVLREVYRGILEDRSIMKIFSKEDDAIDYALKLAENEVKENLVLYGIRGGIEYQELENQDIGITRYTVRCQGYTYNYVVERMKVE